jgi:hypothetical protein
MKGIINLFKKNIFFLFLMLIFAHNYRFFFNAYDLMNINYQKRLIRFHGNCGKESFGFIDRMYKKHSIKINVKILNYADFPSTSAFFFKLSNFNNDEYLIVLNKKYLELKKEGNFFSIWKLIDFEDNCYLFKKK